MKFVFFVTLSLVIHAGLLLLTGREKIDTLKYGVSKGVIQVAMKRQTPMVPQRQSSQERRRSKTRDKNSKSDAQAASQIISQAKSNSQINPIYPERARVFGIQGKVEIIVRISRTGKVMIAKVNKTSGHEILDFEALRAVKRATFAPALSTLGPVDSETILTFNFGLR